MPGPDERALMVLGLATRAGRTSSGDEACRTAIQKGLASLVLVATDASPGTQERFRRLCETFGPGFRVFGTKEGLGRFTGRLDRAVVTVNDEGFSARLTELVDQARPPTSRSEGGGQDDGTTR